MLLYNNGVGDLMNKIIFYIKKFVAILLSFLFGAFHSDKKQEKSNLESKEENAIKKDKRRKIQRITREDESSTKNLSNQKNEIDDVLYYAKKDIQKLMMIQKNIIDLEYQINNTNNLEDLYKLEKELAKEKSKLEKIASYYDKIDINYKEIKDVKNVILENRKLIKDKEKFLSKKIYNEKKKNQEVIIEENLDKELEKPLEEKTNSDDEIVEEEKQVEEDKKEERQVSTTLTPILELITIKEITEIIKNKKTKKQEINNNLEEPNISQNIEEKIIVQVENKEKDKIESRKEKINKNLVITKVNLIQKKQKMNNLSAINQILSKAKSLVQQVNLNSVLQMNAMVAINTSLTINNYIRRARSLTGKRVKKLKLDRVIRKVGNNPRIMVKAIMNNSLSEIRKLKAELKQYELSDELIEALDSLNEMELEILNQMQEMENVHNLNQSHTR